MSEPTLKILTAKIDDVLRAVVDLRVEMKVDLARVEGRLESKIEALDKKIDGIDKRLDANVLDAARDRAAAREADHRACGGHASCG